jgi:hypothetical protein
MPKPPSLGLDCGCAYIEEAANRALLWLSRASVDDAHTIVIFSATSKEQL